MKSPHLRAIEHEKGKCKGGATSSRKVGRSLCWTPRSEPSWPQAERKEGIPKEERRTTTSYLPQEGCRGEGVRRGAKSGEKAALFQSRASKRSDYSLTEKSKACRGEGRKAAGRRKKRLRRRNA